MKMSEKDKKRLEELDKEMEDAVLDFDRKRQDKILDEILKIKKKYNKK